jgi:lysine-ketoglutarate reductase/saccharopine dehydrogenase-like protein (TIGR00300 family)
MAFQLPVYHHPDFPALGLDEAPDVRWATVERDGVIPEGFHSTSMFPEYLKVNGTWVLAESSRMDACIIRHPDGSLRVATGRHLHAGEKVALGRSEDGSEGIYVHTDGFETPNHNDDKFAFRQGRSRETAYKRDYDELIDLLRYERDHGFVEWVMGPAFAFDADSRHAMQRLVEEGYVDALSCGNALATHDLEGAMFHTALGQDIVTQEVTPNGHYHHLDTINRVRNSGSIAQFIDDYDLHDGIMCACVRKGVPYVLAGSIRDDGPLPETIGDAYEAQHEMRVLARKATTVICMATMLHTIATGNMTPSYYVNGDGTVRPVYMYAVDASEFVVNKLHDRGSLSARTIVTNVQDFIFIVAKGLGVI